MSHLGQMRTIKDDTSLYFWIQVGFYCPPEPVNVFLLCPCMAPLSKFNIQFHNTTVQILLQFDRGKFPHHTINLEISTKLTKNVLKQSTVFNLVYLMVTMILLTDDRGSIFDI